MKRILTNELYIGVMVNHKTITNKIRKTKTQVPKDEQYRHENFCEPIIEESVWNQAQFLLSQRGVIKPRSKNGNKLHRYTGIIKCADCGSSMIARKRKWRGNEYTEYTCNSCHRYGKQSQVIQGIIDEGIISDTHLRMLVNQVQVHQNKDKSLDIKFRMNGNWSGGVAVYVEPENEVITC